MAALEGGAVSCERGTPVGLSRGSDARAAAQRDQSGVQVQGSGFMIQEFWCRVEGVWHLRGERAVGRCQIAKAGGLAGGGWGSLGA